MWLLFLLAVPIQSTHYDRHLFRWHAHRVLLIAFTFRDAIKFNIHGCHIDDASGLIFACRWPGYTSAHVWWMACAPTHTFGRACVAHFKMMTVVMLLAIKLPYIGSDGSMAHIRSGMPETALQTNAEYRKHKKKEKIRKCPISWDCKCAMCAGLLLLDPLNYKPLCGILTNIMAAANGYLIAFLRPTCTFVARGTGIRAVLFVGAAFPCRKYRVNDTRLINLHRCK